MFLKIIISLFFLINILAILYKKNSKIIDWLVLIFFVFISSSSIEYHDYTNYLSQYNNENSTHIVLYFIMKLFKDLGCTYNEFLFLLFFISYLLIFYIIKNLAANRSIVYLLYFFYPFFLDIIQIKNFLLEVILVFSIGFYIIKKKKINSIIIYIISLGIHEASVLYLPIWFLKEKKIKKIIPYLFLLFTGIYLSYYLGKNYLMYLLSFLPKWKQEAYSMNISKLGWIIPLIFQLVNFYLANYMLKKLLKYFNIKYIFLKKVLLYSLFFLGLYYLHAQFERLYRNLLIFNYIIISNYYIYIKKYTIIIIAILWILLISYFYVFNLNLDTLILKNNFINR